MYLWVILATFLTMLYSFNLSVRADMDRVHAETKASVTIAKLRMQQNALKDALAAQDPHRTGLTAVCYRPGDGVNVSSSSSSDSSSSDSENTEQSCPSGPEIPIADYLPMGYRLDTGDSAPISKVFCFHDTDRIDGDPAHPETYDFDYNCSQSTANDDRSCCSDPYTSIYVVTFQPIRSRWINHNTGMPNADLLGAAVRVPGYGKSFGYTMLYKGKKVLSGGQRIVTYEDGDEDGAFDESGEPKVKAVTYEYRRIMTPILSDEDFIAKCGKQDEDVHCLFAIQQIYS
jgi:hypothetical protein